jgi:integrase
MKTTSSAAQSEGEERALLSCSSTYLQDLATFAINTGLRLGEIVNLRWEEVDVETGILTLLVRKNRRMLEVRLNDKPLSVVKGWLGIGKCDYVFDNAETGEQWKDFVAGPQ